jgi:hypothetical protein
MKLDLSVAERQAFGGSYAKPANQDEQLARIKAGTIRIPPHGDWTGDYTDWHADPFKDRNWQFQFHSLRWLTSLRWAALEGDDQARSEWLRIARSWFEANVPFTPGLAPFAWKDMTDGNRAIHLSLGAELAGEDDEWFADLLRYHRDWLMDPDHIKGKNHGLHQHTGLLVVAATLCDREAMDTAVSRMERQFVTTFDDQGCNDEGSVGYQQHNLKWWRTSWHRASLEGYEIEGVRERLAAGANALAHLTMPNGQLPQIGDTARGSVSTGLHAFTDFASSRGAVGEKPRGNVLVLDGGYVISRSGWGEHRPMAQESHMVLRHGPDVKAHSHNDRGSLHIYANGTRWLTDSGFYSYQPRDPVRRHLASRAGHNLAFLSGVDHDRRVPVELVSQSVTDTAHDFKVLDRGYVQGEVARRVVYFPGPDCWIVVDSSTSPTAVPLVQHWHLEPGTTSRFRDRGFRLNRDGAALGMTWLGRAPSNLRRHIADDGDMRGWIGTAWKTLSAGALLTATAPAAESSRLVTLISPNKPQPLGVVESLVQSDGSVSAVLVRGGRSWSVRIGSSETRVVED